MTRDDAIHLVSYWVDDALNGGLVHTDTVIPANARLVGFEAGFAPLFVAVWSYLPGVTLTSSEAAELAADYLQEIDWFDMDDDAYRASSQSDLAFIVI